MKKTILKHVLFYSILLSDCCLLSAQPLALDVGEEVIDLQEVEVSSIKVTGAFRQEPVAVSAFSAGAIERNGIDEPNKLSALVPNFYMPAYGSKLSSAVYIRGVGSRMNDSAVGLYVDNVPLLDKSVYDFDFFDLAGIELLRGPQGSLFGRNAMAGIIQVYTPSPLTHRGTKVSLTYGSANTVQANAVHYARMSRSVGISLAANYRQTDGFFTNEYNGKSADELKSGALRLRADWQISPRWLLNYIVSGEKSRQNGYPYARLNVRSEAGRVSFNDESSYERLWVLNSLRLQYKAPVFTLESATSYQYFDDYMKMDQDFRPESLFTLGQKQRQHSVTQEFVVKPNTRSRYRWLFGAFGFYKDLKADALVEFKEQGIADIIQKALDDAKVANPNMPSITLVDGDRSSERLKSLLIPSAFKTPVVGTSAFHQSLFRFFDGLTATVGLRLDYEKLTLDYHSFGSAYFLVQDTRIPRPVWSLRAPDIAGEIHSEYVELLPKIALQYSPKEENYSIFVSAAKGYTAGGFNTQLFADLIQASFRSQAEMTMTEKEVKETVSYQPEHTWNYELGGRASWLKNCLQAEASVFYIDSRNRQVAQFVESGMGRVMKNVARSESYGAEVSLAGYYKGFSANLTYGYTHATFREYKDNVDGAELDYKGKFVPFAPQHTFALGVAQRFDFTDQWIDNLTVGVQTQGVGKIYFDEANTLAQDFYGLLNTNITVKKGIFALSFWAKNITDTRYNVFAFYSLNEAFRQQGTPQQAGLTLKLRIE